jgi:hypothetical protein
MEIEVVPRTTIVILRFMQEAWRKSRYFLMACCFLCA